MAAKAVPRGSVVVKGGLVARKEGTEAPEAMVGPPEEEEVGAAVEEMLEEEVAVVAVMVSAKESSRA